VRVPEEAAEVHDTLQVITPLPLDAALPIVDITQPMAKPVDVAAPEVGPEPVGEPTAELGGGDSDLTGALPGTSEEKAKKKKKGIFGALFGKKGTEAEAPSAGFAAVASDIAPEVKTEGALRTFSTWALTCF
jgi:hypothetical protein